MIDFKGSHVEQEIILWGVRWYVADPISYRHLEEMMEERGVSVDHATLNRWVRKYAPEIEKQFRTCKRRIGTSWRMSETDVRVKGQSKYLAAITAPGRRAGVAGQTDIAAAPRPAPHADQAPATVPTAQ